MFDLLFLLTAGGLYGRPDSAFRQRTSMRVFQSERRPGRRFEVTISNVLFLGLFLKVPLKLFNGYHFNLLNPKPEPGMRWCHPKKSEGDFKMAPSERLYLFSFYNLQRFSALLVVFVARLALVAQCDSSGVAPGIGSFLEPYSELYLLLEQFFSSVSTSHAEIFLKMRESYKMWVFQSNMFFLF